MTKSVGGERSGGDDSRTVRWFGEAWPSPHEPAPVCSDRKWRVATPAGETCLFCPEDIRLGDKGVVMPYAPSSGPAILAPVHLECLLKDVFGSKLAYSFP